MLTSIYNIYMYIHTKFSPSSEQPDLAESSTELLVLPQECCSLAPPCAVLKKPLPALPNAKQKLHSASICFGGVKGKSLIQHL